MKQMIKPLLEQLEEKYGGRVVIWSMDNGNRLYLDQKDGNMTKGFVIAEVSGKDRVSLTVRSLTQEEYGTIENFWMAGAEPHDFEAYKNDEYSVEQ